MTFKRENPPQVAQPLIKGRVRFAAPLGNGSTVELQGKEYYLPNFEEYRIAIVKPRGSVTKHNKLGWEAFEITSGKRIFTEPYQLSTEQRTIAGALQILNAQGKARLDAAISK